MRINFFTRFGGFWIELKQNKKWLFFDLDPPPPLTLFSNVAPYLVKINSALVPPSILLLENKFVSSLNYLSMREHLYNKHLPSFLHTLTPIVMPLFVPLCLAA